MSRAPATIGFAAAQPAGRLIVDAARRQTSKFFVPASANSQPGRSRSSDLVASGFRPCYIRPGERWRTGAGISRGECAIMKLLSPRRAGRLRFVALARSRCVARPTPTSQALQGKWIVESFEYNGTPVEIMKEARPRIQGRQVHAHPEVGRRDQRRHQARLDQEAQADRPRSQRPNAQGHLRDGRRLAEDELHAQRRRTAHRTGQQARLGRRAGRSQASRKSSSRASRAGVRGWYLRSPTHAIVASAAHSVFKYSSTARFSASSERVGKQMSLGALAEGARVEIAPPLAAGLDRRGKRSKRGDFQADLLAVVAVLAAQPNRRPLAGMQHVPQASAPSRCESRAPKPRCRPTAAQRIRPGP